MIRVSDRRRFDFSRSGGGKLVCFGRCNRIIGLHRRGVVSSVYQAGVSRTFIVVGLYTPVDPSAAYWGPGAYFAVSQAGNGVLWAYSSKLQASAQSVTVVSGTSPSISYDDNTGRYITYFQSAPGTLGYLSDFGGKDVSS